MPRQVRKRPRHARLIQRLTIPLPPASQRDDAIYRLERLQAALAPLQARYSRTAAGRAAGAWRADYAEVKAKRDATAEKLQAIYTELTEQLIEVLEEAKQVDEEVARINCTAPNGEHDRLLTMECAARRRQRGRSEYCAVADDRTEAAALYRPGLGLASTSTMLTAEMVVPAGMLTHPGDNWAAHQKEAKAQADSEAKRVANYYRRQKREKEDMDNARSPSRTGTAAAAGVNMNAVCGRVTSVPAVTEARSDPCGEYGDHTPARHAGWGLLGTQRPVIFSRRLSRGSAGRSSRE